MKAIGIPRWMPVLTPKRVAAGVLLLVAICAAVYGVASEDIRWFAASLVLLALVVVGIAAGTYRRVGEHIHMSADAAMEARRASDALQQMATAQSELATMLRRGGVHDLRTLVLGSFRELLDAQESTARNSALLAERVDGSLQHATKLEALVQAVEARLASVGASTQSIVTELTEHLTTRDAENSSEARRLFEELLSTQCRLHSGLEEQLQSTRQEVLGHSRGLASAAGKHDVLANNVVELGNQLKLFHGEVVPPIRKIEREIVGQHLRYEVLNDALAMEDVRKRFDQRAAAPLMSGWSLEPSTLLRLLEFVERVSPRLVVECGSGVSTVWLAYAMGKYGGRVIALEHHADFAAETRAELARHGLSEVADVRHAPLESFDLQGGAFQWYAREAWEGLREVELLLVDGPPKATGPLARYPALPLLAGSLASNATIVLDDMHRPEEREALERWIDAFPQISKDHLMWGERTVALGWSGTQ